MNWKSWKGAVTFITFFLLSSPPLSLSLSLLTPLPSRSSRSISIAVIGMQRLRTMIAVLVLRRTKEDISATHKLPNKIIETHLLDLSPEEQSVYDMLFFEARSHSHSCIPVLDSPDLAQLSHPRKVFVQFLAEMKTGVSEDTDTAPPPLSVPVPPPPLSSDMQCCVDEILHSFRGGHVRAGAVLVMLLRSAPCSQCG